MKVLLVCTTHGGAEPYPDCLECGTLTAALRAGYALVAAVHSPGPARVSVREATPGG